MAGSTGTGATVVKEQGERELLMWRTFNATPEQVFKAWTDAEALKQWWGPRSWPTVYCTVDLRTGGAWHYCMRSVDGGQESWGKAIYEEIAAPERLVYVDAFSDKDGNVFPPQMHVTVRFIAEGGRTRVESLAVFESAAERQKVLEMGVVAGMTETQDRLDEYLASLR